MTSQISQYIQYAVFAGLASPLHTIAAVKAPYDRARSLAVWPYMQDLECGSVWGSN